MQFQASTNVTASAQKVFGIYANVADWPTWDHELKAASVHGAFIEGATGEVVPKGGPKSAVTFTGVQQDKRFTVACKLPLCNMYFDHELSPNQGGVTATHGVRFEGLMAPVFGFLIGRGMKKTLPQALQSLKMHAEAA